MKSLNIIMSILCFMILLLLAIIGMNHPMLAHFRPLFAVCMDLAVVFFIIGYISAQKELEKRRERWEIITDILRKGYLSK